MSDSCFLHFDADDVARGVRGELPRARQCSFEDHLATCASCGRIHQVTSWAHQAWRADAHRDHAFARTASESRLLCNQVRRDRGATWKLAFVVAICGLTIGITSAFPHFRPGAATRGLPTASDPTHGITVRSPPRGVPSEVVGDVATVSAQTLVPAGVTLSLDWNLVEGSRETADGGIRVEGPAAFRVSHRGPTAMLLLERGVLRARSKRKHEVRSAFLRVQGQDAEWNVTAYDERTRVDVVKGEVNIEPEPSDGSPQAGTSIGAGQSVDMFRGGRLERVSTLDVDGVPARALGGVTTHGGDGLQAPSEPLGPPVSSSLVPRSGPPATRGVPVRGGAAQDIDAALWKRAHDAIDRNDRPLAETLLESLADPKRASKFRERAEFALAELELSRGAANRARERLWSLLRSKDPSLAEDSALIMAHAARPSERVNIWIEYSSMARPSPYRERAMVERASALFEAGNHDAAKAVVLQLGTKAPASIQARLSALEAKLAGTM